MIFRVAIITALFLNTSYAQDTALIHFEMQDQFNQEHNEEEFLGKLTILIGSDKDGSKYNSRWGSAISDSLKACGLADQFKMMPLADLRGVPFFLKGFVRGKFPKEKDHWVLLDWKGNFAKHYEFEPGKTNILIFSEKGDLLFKDSAQELNSEQLITILDLIKNELLNKQGVN